MELENISTVTTPPSKPSDTSRHKNVPTPKSEPKVSKLEPKSSKPEPKISKPEPKSSQPEPKSSKLEPKSSKPEPKSSKLEPKSSKLEPKISKPELKSSKLEPKISKPEPKSSKLEPKSSKLEPKMSKPELEPIKSAEKREASSDLINNSPVSKIRTETRSSQSDGGIGSSGEAKGRSRGVRVSPGLKLSYNAEFNYPDSAVSLNTVSCSLLPGHANYVKIFGCLNLYLLKLELNLEPIN